jgi:FdhE protein
MRERTAAIFLPDAQALFRSRATRLEALARRSAAPASLEFLARLVDAQRSAAEVFEVPLVASAGSRPLDPIGLERTSAWRDALRRILSSLSAGRLPDEARTAIDQLALAAVERHEASAEDLLSGSLKSENLGQAPFIGAALQVYWSHLAARLDPTALARTGAAGCPACGFPPVAGYVTAGEQVRYLSCSLCSSEWQSTPGQCAACRSGTKLSSYEVEGAAGAVKAETCDECRRYVKLFLLDADPDAEPHADDLATVPLDMLMADARHQRAGRNLLLAIRG